MFFPRVYTLRCNRRWFTKPTQPTAMVRCLMWWTTCSSSVSLLFALYRLTFHISTRSYLVYWVRQSQSHTEYFMPFRAVCSLTTTLIFTDWEPTTFSCQWTVLTEPESLTTRGMDHKHLTTKVYRTVQFSIVFFFLSILTWNNTFKWVGYSRLFVL